jgi:hypothetical protein
MYCLHKNLTRLDLMFSVITVVIKLLAILQRNHHTEGEEITLLILVTTSCLIFTKVLFKIRAFVLSMLGKQSHTNATM